MLFAIYFQMIHICKCASVNPLQLWLHLICVVPQTQESTQLAHRFDRGKGQQRVLIKIPENHLEAQGYRKHPLNSMRFWVAEKVTKIRPLNSMDFWSDWMWTENRFKMGHGSAVDTAVVSQLEGLEECGLRNNQKREQVYSISRLLGIL